METKDFVDKGEFNEEFNLEVCFIAYERKDDEDGDIIGVGINKERTRFCCEPFGKEFKIEGYQGHDLPLFFRLHRNYETKKVTPEVCMYGSLEVWDDDLNYAGVPIQRCPFCGKEIKFAKAKHLKAVKVGCEEVVKKVCKYEYQEVKS